MGVAPGLLSLALCVVSHVIPCVGRIGKRIVDGDPLSSPSDLDTYYFVHVREAWGCLANQSSHRLAGCLESNVCGGTLVHPEFVLTAQHCVSYWEFHLRPSHRLYDPDNLKVEGLSLEELGLFQSVNDGRVVPNKPQSKHAFYSNFVLLAGSVNYFSMNQKRHAYKVFPHPVYYDLDDFSLLEHDVAIVQVCEPFQMTRTVHPPLMKPSDKLAEQFESLVKRSAACLFLGFGETGDNATKVFQDLNRNYLIQTPYLRYTWRHLACPSKCRVDYDPEVAHHNPCLTCTDHIPPRIGTCLDGDSGGPVVCDGYYVGVVVATAYSPSSNSSNNWVYPVHCIRNAITPEAFKYYKTIEPGKTVPLVVGDVPGQSSATTNAYFRRH